MSEFAPNRNLLAGILALQVGFITRDQLISAIQNWSTRKHQLLEDILLDFQISETLTVACLPNRSNDREVAAAVTVPSFQLRGQRFRIVRAHAEGGLGVVSLAHDYELNCEVALKGIKDEIADDPTSRSRFVLEAEITGALGHPSIFLCLLWDMT